MSNELSSIFLNKHFEAKRLSSCDDQDKHLVTAIRNIGFVAACIDMYSWRQVIDEALCDTEAANEKANMLEAVLQSPLVRKRA
jgi:hypothetical protein